MDEAARFYADAIVEAEILFKLVETLALATPAPAPVLINVAYHNAAEAELRRGRPDEAERLCLRAFERLASAAEAQATPAPLRRDCAENLKQALVALSARLVGQGAPPERIRLHIERACRIALGGPRPAEQREAPKPQRLEPGI